MIDWDAMAAPTDEEEDTKQQVQSKSGIDWDAMAAPTDEDKLADMEGPLNVWNEPTDEPVVNDDLMSFFSKEVEAWGEAIKAGWEDSSTGMLSRGQVHEYDPDMNGRHQFIKEFTHAAIDLPIDILTAIPGTIYGGGFGGVITSASLSSGFRQWLIDQYGAGSVDPDDCAGRFMSTLKATAGGAAGGAVGGKVGGKIMAKAAPLYGNMVGHVLSSPVELAAMSTTQSLVQHGELPSLRDFRTAGMAMIAGKSVGAIAGKAQSAHFRRKLMCREHMESKLAYVYAKTGVEPHVIAKMGQNDPHMYNQLLDTRMKVPDALMHMDSSDIMSKVDSGARPPRDAKQAVEDIKNGTVDALVDDLGPIKRAFNQMAGSKDAWDRAAAWMNPYKRAALARGWTGKFEHLLEHGGWDLITGKSDGSKGLLKILRDVDNPEAGTSLKGFTKWMTTRRAMEKEQLFFNLRREYRTEMRDLKSQAALYSNNPKRLTRQDHKDLTRIEDKMASLTKQYEKIRQKRDTNRHTGMKQFDNEQTIRDMEALYTKHEKDFMEFNNSMLKQLKDAGILSGDDLARIMRDNQSYVPFQRLMDQLVEAYGSTGGTKPKLFGGSDRPIRNAFEAYVGSIRKNLQGIEHNTVLNSLKLWDTEGEFIKKRPLGKADQTIEQVASRMGINRDDVSAFDMMQTVKTKGSDKSVIYGYENGQRVAYEVPNDIARSFQNLTGRGLQLIKTDNPAAKLVWTILKKPSDVLRFGATTTPDFMVANLLRDITASFAFSKSANSHMLSWAEGATHLLTKGKSEPYKEMLRSGGQVMGQHRDGTSPHLNRDVYKELTSQPVKNLLSIETLNRLKDNVSDLTEGASRMGEYIAARRGQDHLEAAYRHRDITLDFARAGYLGRYINDIVTFHNAGIQSLSKLHTVMTTGTPAQRLKTMGLLATGVMLPSIVLNWYGGDDERVQQIPQRERDLYWILPTDDCLIRIPKPHEVGVIFGSSIERAMDFWRRDDPRAWEGYMDSVLSKMIPGGLGGPGDFASSITALRPFIEAATNHNFFRDTQLIPHYLEDVAPELQYTQYTTETSRAITGTLGKLGLESSPIVIDNYIQAWTGGAGRYVTSLIDTMLKDNEVRPGYGELKVGDWGWDTWEDLPIIKSFLVRDPETTGRARVIEQFRKRHQEALTEANSVSFLKNNFLFDDMRDRMDKQLWIKNDSIYNMLNEARANIHKFYNMQPGSPGTEGMSDKELARQKAIWIEQMYVNMVVIAEAGLQAYDEIDKIIKENDDGL